MNRQMRKESRSNMKEGSFRWFTDGYRMKRKAGAGSKDLILISNILLSPPLKKVKHKT